jgi:hypothetical protein
MSCQFWKFRYSPVALLGSPIAGDVRRWSDSLSTFWAKTEWLPE